MTRAPTIIVDDFLSEPEAVRQQALGLDFAITGNFPGARALNQTHPYLRASIQSLVGRPILNWSNEAGQAIAGANGLFQISTEADTTWVHSDQMTLRIGDRAVPATPWGGVLYLTPDPPREAGTLFFEHRPTKRQFAQRDTAGEAAPVDPASEDFDVVDSVANIFNRLVLFDSDRFHAAGPAFGSGLTDGRLTQVFFFATR